MLPMNDVSITDWKRWSDEKIERSRFKGPRSHIPRIIQIISVDMNPEYCTTTSARAAKSPNLRSYRLALALNFNFECQCQMCKVVRSHCASSFPVFSDRYLLYTNSVYPVLKLD